MSQPRRWTLHGGQFFGEGSDRLYRPESIDPRLETDEQVEVVELTPVVERLLSEGVVLSPEERETLRVRKLTAARSRLEGVGDE
jgi:hypothetical protein